MKHYTFLMSSYDGEIVAKLRGFPPFVSGQVIEFDSGKYRINTIEWSCMEGENETHQNVFVQPINWNTNEPEPRITKSKFVSK